MERGTTEWFDALCSSGAATVVATTDVEGRAAITRGWGVTISADGAVTLCVSAPDGSRTLANLSATGRLAITVVDPTTYSSGQVKGAATAVRAPTDDERERVAGHVHRFRDAIATVGVADGEGMMLGDLVTVELVVGEVADQTPGDEAGRVLQ